MENNAGSDGSSEDTLFGSDHSPDSVLHEPRGSVEASIAFFQALPSPPVTPSAATSVDSASAIAVDSAAATSAVDSAASTSYLVAETAAVSSSNSAALSESDSTLADVHDADSWKECLAALYAAYPEMRPPGDISDEESPPKTPPGAPAGVYEDSPAGNVPAQVSGSAAGVERTDAPLPIAGISSGGVGPTHAPSPIEGISCSCDPVLLRGISPLQMAARNGCQPCLKQHLVVPQPDSGDFHTPLCLAIEGQFLECVEILVLAGADMDQLSLDWSPLQIAALTGYIPIISLLIEQGANAKITTEKNPLAPVHIAAVKGFFEAVEVLLPHSQREPDVPQTAEGFFEYHGYVPRADA